MILGVLYSHSILEIENCDQYSGCGQERDILHRRKGRAPAIVCVRDLRLFDRLEAVAAQECPYRRAL